MIVLTNAEREHFAAYARQEAESADMMAKQATKALSDSVGEAIGKKYRTEAVAFMMVAEYLTSGEEMTIGG